MVEHPLDNIEILKGLGNVRTVTEKELINYKNIDSLFSGQNAIIILFLFGENEGHWTCLMRDGDYIEFFDSYGRSPDTVYKSVDEMTRHNLGIKRNYLRDLMINCPYQIIYNSCCYQGKNEKGVDINTCGRHVANRIKFFNKGYNNNDYNKYMTNLKKRLKLPYDAIILGIK